MNIENNIQDSSLNKNIEIKNIKIKNINLYE